MLYDPKWEKPADIMTTTALIAWLEKQPEDAPYCYLAHGRCLVAQYLAASGYEDVNVFSHGTFNHSGGRDASYPIAFDEIALKIPRTFGAALRRAKQAGA